MANLSNTREFCFSRSFAATLKQYEDLTKVKHWPREQIEESMEGDGSEAIIDCQAKARTPEK